MPRNHPGHTVSHQADTENTRHGSRHTDASLHAGMSEANVKMVPTETGWSRGMAVRVGDG